MSEFVEKMRRNLGGAAAAARAPDRSVERLRKLEKPPPMVAIEGRGKLPTGHIAESEDGCFFVREVSFDLEHRHGEVTLSEGISARMDLLSRLAGDAALCQDSLEDALFLDTETTGLAGGVGTVVFLTGMGKVHEGRFVVRQVFLRAFAEERPALLDVARACEGAKVLVTFFGKSFDRHRLADRMDLHRIPHGLRSHRHLDLYHLHRAVHGKALPDGRLKTAEDRMLGVRRRDDLPGAYCPGVYFDWLRSHRGPIDRVFEHNLLDVLSLVTLAARLARDPAESDEPGLLLAHARRMYRDEPAAAAEFFERGGALDAAAKARRRAERKKKNGQVRPAVRSRPPLPTAAT